MAAQIKKVPSFKGYTSSSDIQTRAKRAIRSSNTAPEIALRRALHRLGLRFRLNTGHLPGRPDLIFPSARVAIFCDGDFWHGRDWDNLSISLGRRANPDYWLAKIEYNRNRDIEVTQELANVGWRVMRLWEGDILQDPDEAAKRVKMFLYAAAAPNTLEVEAE